MLVVLTFRCCLVDAANSNSLASRSTSDARVSSAPAKRQLSSRKSKRAFYHSLENSRVANLLGMRVENVDGQVVGDLEDFIIDVRSRRLLYALVASGGFLGLHKQFRIFPPQLLSSATSKRGVLELNVGNLRWRRAPRFKYSQLSSLAHPEQQRQIYHYYGQAFSRPPAASPIVRQVGHRERNDAKRNLQFASAMLGKPLLTTSQELVGKVADMLVDFKGQKPVLALVSPTETLPDHGSFAVSLQILRPHQADSFIVDATRKMFATAPALDAPSWFAADRYGTTLIHRLADRETEQEIAAHSIMPNQVLSVTSQATPVTTLTTQQKESYGKN